MSTRPNGVYVIATCLACGHVSQLDPCQQCLYASENPHVRLPVIA